MNYRLAMPPLRAMEWAMRRRVAKLVTVGLFGLWLGGSAAPAAEWSRRDGRGLPGEPTSFDPERKTVFFRDSISEREMVVPTRELSLRSRQRMLFSPVFHLRGREEGWLRSPSKRSVIAKGAGAAALALGIGFWLSGWCIADRRNPLLAGIGFVGTWVLTGALAAFYAFLKVRVEGGAGVVLIGFAATLALAGLYVSAVYACRYWRGLLVLLGHLAAGFCLLAIGFAAGEILAGRERAEAWWTTEVFEPIGLTAPQASRTDP